MSTVEHDRRGREREHIGDYPHVDGITRGTIVEYSDWQWALITEIAADHDPPMFGFILLDDIDDTHIQTLESAWGCWEHYVAVQQFRDTKHEYWTKIEYVTESAIWSVRGPVHPDAREDEPEATA